MPTNALRTTDLCRCAAFVFLACLLTGAPEARAAAPKQVRGGTSAPAGAPKTAQPQKNLATGASAAVIKEWGPYLDVAYELTYWDKAEIKEWREKRDGELSETLAAYTAAMSSRLASAGTGAAAVGQVERPAGLREREYLRLTIALTLDYLQSDNRESLNSAALVVERLKGKSQMPEIAFWTAYVKALQALESNDPDLFVARAFDIWNNSILYFEQGYAAQAAANANGATPAQYYYRNLINLVVNRAIVNRKMDGLNALGPLFLMLKERVSVEKDGEGKYFATLVQRIADGLTAPDSDRYRLNFTVAMIESKRLQQSAAAKLDAEGMTESAQGTFERSQQFNELALKWAASPRSSGVILAAAEHLDSISFAIQRLPDNEKAKAYAFFAALPGREGSSALSNAMAIFNDIAVYSGGSWKKAGYENRELYIKAAHRLWRSIMELSLWTGDFYLAKLNVAGDQQGIYNYATPMQQVLDSYLYFLSSQSSRGFDDVIPDSAYFGAAEAAEKLAYAYQRINLYSMDTSAYNLWFLHRLQATELFPLAPREVGQAAVALRQEGRYTLFLDYYMPLAGRIKQSAAIKKWIEDNRSDNSATIRSYVASVDEYFAAGSGTGPDGSARGSAGRGATVIAFQQMREEMQRKPDHPVHRLLRAFYAEEMQRDTNYTRLLKDPNRINRGL
jgi:hypothetical protein